MTVRPWDSDPKKPIPLRVLAAIRQPTKILDYLVWRWNRLQVREAFVDSKVYHVYRGDWYPDELHRGNACAHIADVARRYCLGSGLDVGAGPWPLKGAVPIRDEPHRNAYELDIVPDRSLDYVFSSHCLEHLDRWREALGLWIRKLKPGGILFLYLPHESMKMWHRRGPWVGLGHKWRPRHEVLVPFLDAQEMEVIELNRERDEYWSFHIVARRRSEPPPSAPGT